MKRVFGWLAIFTLAIFVAPSAGYAQQSAGVTHGATNIPAVGATDARFMPVEQIKPGMQAVARTVFSGTEPEEFGLEILGILPGFLGAKQPAIIARLKDVKTDRTGVFGGMSGSPVYIDGKLIGAIAFSFPFSKEPIAGITPIQSMVDIFTRGTGGGTAAPREPRPVSFTQLASTEWQANLPKPAMTGGMLIANVSAGSPLIPLLGQQMQPIATPLVFSGISQETLNIYAPQLIAHGLLPVSGVGGAGAITPLAKADATTLQPGDSVSAQLVRGDYSIAASGTVTFRDGNRIYAFGHPFLSLGGTEMAMAESSVITVIPNANNSFKLAVPEKLVGMISQDRATGIFGEIGRAPKMILVKLTLHTSRNQTETYNFEVVNDTFLTPLLMNISIFNTISASERSISETTLSLKGQIKVANQPTIDIERRFSAANAPVFAAGSIAAPVQALLNSGFENVNIEGVNLEINVDEARNNATLERIALDRTEARRGETVEVQAYVRTEAGRQFVQRIPVKIPADVPLGQILVFVGDGDALQKASPAQAFVPRELGDLVGAINQVKKNDRLYVKLFRITSGAVIATSELPNLPPSMMATLNSERSAGGFTQTVLSPVFEKELPPADFVINGQQLIALDIIR